jgi:Excalibur calcium-binding domain
MKITRAAALSVATAVALLGTPAVAGQAASAPGIYKNCTALHTKYKHGVGRTNAHDHTSGKPVTSFTHSTSAYNAAVKANADLDRDRDGIACEKA